MKSALAFGVGLILTLVAGATKTQTFELQAVDKRMPSQVTSDFGSAFIKQIKTSGCTEDIARSIYGSKFTQNELYKKLKSEASEIKELFSQLMEQKFGGREQCGDTAYGMANELIQHGACFIAVAEKLYKLDDLDKNSDYVFEKKRFDKLIETKEKIDQFNMPLMDDNSCAKQGKQTYLDIVRRKAKKSVSLARVFLAQAN